MPCQTPWRDDSAQVLLFKIASCLAEGGPGGIGVFSFNGRTGVVTLTSGDVTTALGFTPISQADGDSRYVLKAGDTMTGSLNIANSAILVASDPALDITQTWNNAAVTFTGLQSNITNTASSTNSNLFNFQVDGSDRFNFTTGGTLRAIRQDASDLGVNFLLRKRGNAGGATNAVAADSTIGAISYSGWDGTAFATGSHIDGLAAEAWTNIAHGSRLTFYTTPIGSTTEQISLRLDSNGQARFLDGTAPLPSLTFQSDPDTGIYRIGANSLGISAGGVLRLTVDGTSTTSAGTLLIPDGTVALPGLAFSADTDTGLYRIGANVLGASVGGVRITSWSSVGLGVGTDAAVFKLDLNGTATTAHRKIGINGVQVVYLPDQAAGAFSGSIFFGTGGNSLSHAAGAEGQFNTGVGVGALFSNTTGSFNAAIGYNALFSNTTGTINAAIGYNALFSNTTGTINAAIGYNALFANTTGTHNIATGSQALFSNTTGTFSVAIGFNALSSNTTGSRNSAVGFQALFDLTTPATGQNTAIGYNTGRGITTGDNNTIIGANVTGLAAALSNNIILADGAGNIRLQIDSSGNTTLAGTLATGDGTAALPAKTFSADLNTGLYRIGADSIGTSTGGTLRTTTNTTDLILATAFRLAFASGANQRAGNATLVAGTVTVANTSVTANSVILLTRKTSGGTLGTAVTYSVIAATSFTITSDSALDTSVFSYLIVEVP